MKARFWGRHGEVKEKMAAEMLRKGKGQEHCRRGINRESRGHG